MVSDTVHDGGDGGAGDHGDDHLDMDCCDVAEQSMDVIWRHVHIAGSSTEFRSIHAHSNILIISYRSKAKIRSKSNITETMMNDDMIILEIDEIRLNDVRDN